MNKAIRVQCTLLMLAFALAGCGGDDDGTSERSYGPGGGGDQAASQDKPEEPAKRIRASVWRATSEDVEKGIFDFDGFTLYRFSEDRGSRSACYGACAERWPPLLTELKPRGVDVLKSKLGTTKRRGGAIQVTYFGHPLYTFVGDKTTGDANGHRVEAFGGTWYALKANGQDAK